MDIVNLIRRALSPERRSVSWDSTDALDLFGRRTTKAGQTVTAETALSIMAVYAAVRIIAEGMGSLPLHAYRQGKDGIPLKFSSPPSWLEEPNVGLALTRQDLISQMLVSLLLRGNAYVAIIRSGLAIVGLEVLDPDTVTPHRVGGFVRYTVGAKEYSTDEILHVRGLTLPGAIKGVDPITYAAATIGTGLAAQEYGANYFENASTPGGYIAVPAALSEVGAKLLRKTWNRLHSGAANAGSVGVLTEGAEFRTISLSPEQTQFLEARRFTVQDVARLFGLPPHVLADSSNSTSWGSGLAEQNTAMAKLTFTPWAERIDVALTRLLRSEGGPRTNTTSFVRMHLEGFERGSYSDRIATYAAGIAAGIYDPDEIRAWEDLPPLERPEPPTPQPPPPSEPEGGPADPAQEPAA